MKSYDASTLHRLTMAGGEVKRDADGLFRTTGKYWSLTLTQLERLAALGYCRIDRVGSSTFATLIEKKETA